MQISPPGSLCGSRWYVVYTLPRMEATAQAHLERQGFEVFFPRILVTRRHARKIESVRALLFPRYGFVRLDLERNRWRSVNGTIGVAGFVMSGERPQPVPPGIVETILASTDAQGLASFAGGLKPGDQVRLVAGPFSGELGVLARLDDKGRVELLISCMNGMVRLKVCRELLAAAV